MEIFSRWDSRFSLRFSRALMQRAPCRLVSIVHYAKASSWPHELVTCEDDWIWVSILRYMSFRSLTTYYRTWFCESSISFIILPPPLLWWSSAWAFLWLGLTRSEGRQWIWVIYQSWDGSWEEIACRDVVGTRVGSPLKMKWTHFNLTLLKDRSAASHLWSIWGIWGRETNANEWPYISFNSSQESVRLLNMILYMT